jgi:hypothetical protein
MKKLTLIRQIILLSERRSKRHPHLNPLHFDKLSVVSPVEPPSRERKLDRCTSSDSLMSFSISPGRAPTASCCLKQGRKNIGLGLKMANRTVAAILVFLWMVLPGSALAAERKSDLRVTYSPPRISVEARGVKLREVLRDVSLKVGFELTDYGIPDRDLTVSIEETTVEDLLRQLLRGENYGLVYREKDRAISKVLLLSPPVYAQAAPMSENQQTRTEAIRGREGLTVFSASPSIDQPRRPEQKRGNETENETKVEDILRIHANSGLTGSDTSLQSLTPNVPQPLRNSTPAFPPTGATSFTTRSLGDTNDNLAMTTRLAQQNLKALADGLANATQSLLNYPANK